MQTVSKFIFGPTQEERVKAVQSKLRSEQRALDREMRSIDGAAAKAKSEVKRLAKKGDVKNARILAREVVRSNKQKNRLALSKARLNSIHMQLQHQMGERPIRTFGRHNKRRLELTHCGLCRDKSNVQGDGSMQKSTEIMKLSNQLVKLPQVSKVMREMSQEMMKAGIMEELLDDTLDSGVLGEDDEELETEAEGEVDKVLFQLTDGKLGQAQDADALPELKGQSQLPPSRKTVQRNRRTCRGCRTPSMASFGVDMLVVISCTVLQHIPNFRYRQTQLQRTLSSSSTSG
ncbi:hypothetical protein L7F22_012842 [Adiantum nelumboides]|nr:hypothetical protein [Adiantum nelumboides]